MGTTPENTSPERALDTARRVIDHEIAGIQSMREALDETFERVVDLVLSRKGRVIVTGMGKSGIIGKKISATLASTGTASYFLHPAEAVHGDLGIVHRDDTVIALSRSGNTDELDHVLPVLKKLGVPIVAMTSNRDSVLGAYADEVLDLAVHEEACPYNLAPTTSAAATLVLGDALAIALLERRGFQREDYAVLHPAGSLGKRLVLRVDDVMVTDEHVAHVSPDRTMREAVLEMATKRGLCSVVDEAMRVKGVITTGDLNRLVEHTEHFFGVPVVEVMNTTPKVVASGTLAYTAYKKMEDHGVIAMPVLDDQQRLIGVIHLHDLMRAGIF